uniref:Uncharacterized protein n=1 Tax=Desulfovibrio sp. U5L TaxID=596152 RepID=I2Q778_9BACT
MHVPNATDPVWEDLVTGKRANSLRFLAAKILLARLTRAVGADLSPDTIRTSAEQLHAIFANNQNMPTVQEDLRAILDRQDPAAASPPVS